MYYVKIMYKKQYYQIWQKNTCTKHCSKMVGPHWLLLVGLYTSKCIIFTLDWKTSEYVGISITCFTDVGLENVGVSYTPTPRGCSASYMRWEKELTSEGRENTPNTNTSTHTNVYTLHTCTQGGRNLDDVHVLHMSLHRANDMGGITLYNNDVVYKQFEICTFVKRITTFPSTKSW